MRKALIVVAVLLLARAALACTGYLTGERVVTVKRNGYERQLRMCYYDHLGDPLVISVPATSFCRNMISVAHPGEDRDGDGKDDGGEE